MAAYNTSHREEERVNITLAINTLFNCRNLAPTQVREKFDKVSAGVHKVMCFLVLIRSYYSRLTDSNLGVRGAHLKSNSMFDAADEDGVEMTMAEFKRVMDAVIIKDTAESKVKAVKKLYSCVPDVSEIRKFIQVLLTEDVNGVRIDYAFFVRFYPHTEPWFYMWPRLGDRMIVGCIRPYISQTLPRPSSDEELPAIMPVPSDEKEYMQYKWDGHRHYLVMCRDGVCYLVSRKGLVRRVPDDWPSLAPGLPAEEVIECSSNAGDFEELSERQDIHSVFDGELIAREMRTGTVLPATSVSSVFKDATIFGTFIIFDAAKLNGVWIDDLPLNKRLDLLEKVYTPVREMSPDVGNICLTKTFKADYNFYTTVDRVEGLIFKKKKALFGGVISLQEYDPSSVYGSAYLTSEKTNDYRKFKWGSDEITVACFYGTYGNGKLSGKISSLNMCVLFEGQFFCIGKVSITNSKYHKMLASEIEGVTDGLTESMYHSGISDVPSHMSVKGVKCKNRVKFKRPFYLDVLGDAGLEYQLKDTVVQLGIRNVRPVRFREEDDCQVTDVTEEVKACALRY